KAFKKIELPLVVGVLADLSAQPREALPPLKQRAFVPIDRDNFNDVLQKAAPRLAVKVPNRLTDDDTQLVAELTFSHLDDFEPGRVAEQIGPLRELLAVRQCLTQLLSKLDGNDPLDQFLTFMLNNTAKAQTLAAALGERKHY